MRGSKNQSALPLSDGCEEIEIPQNHILFPGQGEPQPLARAQGKELFKLSSLPARGSPPLTSAMLAASGNFA